MADNTTYTPGAGVTIAADDVGGVLHQRVKLVSGADGVAVDVSSAAPLPVLALNAEGRTPGTDVFGRLRVGQAFTLADLIMRYEIDARDWQQTVSGSGSITYLPNEQAARLSLTSDAGEALLRTHQYFRYQAGKGQWIRMTGYHTLPTGFGQEREWGYFDAQDGLFFKTDEVGLSLVRRSFTSGVATDTLVRQGDWNVDNLDGTGPSGTTIDLTKTQIYEIEFQHLAVGSVYWRVNGQLIHVSRHANLLSVPYMRTAQLPVSIRISNPDAGDAGAFTMICCSVESHGGTEPPSETFSAPGALADVSVSTTEIPLLSIRLKSTYGGKANRMLVVPAELNVNLGNAARVRLVLNATLTGANWVSADPRSGVEYDLSATTGSGGQPVWARSFVAAASETRDLQNTFGYPNRFMHLSADGATSDVLTVFATKSTAGTIACRAAMTWGEIR